MKRREARALPCPRCDHSRHDHGRGGCRRRGRSGDGICPCSGGGSDLATALELLLEIESDVFSPVNVTNARALLERAMEVES